MGKLDLLSEKNREWALSVKTSEPLFFEKLATQQNPGYLWIGCSDSRVPANQIVGLMPGEMFVHRNIANMVVPTDLNCMTVLQYAVEVLKVKHVMVVGHYGCGGVAAAYENADNGLIDKWLRNIKDVQQNHQLELDQIKDKTQRLDLLCELNVAAQVSNVCHTATAQNAWQRGQSLSIHGWIYSLADGLLKDLECTVDRPEQITDAYPIES